MVTASEFSRAKITGEWPGSTAVLFRGETRKDSVSGTEDRTVRAVKAVFGG